MTFFHFLEDNLEQKDQLQINSYDWFKDSEHWIKKTNRQFRKQFNEETGGKQRGKKGKKGKKRAKN